MLIYKITNKINKKVYIGQTTRKLKSRWRGHVSSSVLNKSNNLFHNAIQKYGEDAFEVEQIDFANSREELDVLEKHYIEKFDSLHPNGYNLKTGATGARYSSHSKNKMREAKLGTTVSETTKQRMRDTHKERWTDISLRERKSETSKELWKDPKYRKAILKARKEYWADQENRDAAAERAKEMAKDEVYLKKISDGVKAAQQRSEVKKKMRRHYAKQEKALLCSDGRIFRSVKEAANMLGLKSSSIVKTIKGRYKSSGGYTFKYLEDCFEKKPKMYLLTGVSGAGKSWIARQLDPNKYISYDEEKKEDHRFLLLKSAYKSGHALFDPCVGVSTAIKQYTDIFDVELLVILEDESVIRERLALRGGKFTDSISARMHRMFNLSEKATFSGTSSEVLAYLKTKL